MERPPEIVLYGPRIAPYVEKVRRALVYKGLPFELHEPNSPEDYGRFSPDTGLLPVITIDGERVSDSTNILLRLDDQFPDPPLLSGDPKIAAQQRQLEDWADESFLWYFLQWVNFREPPTSTPDRPARPAPISGTGSERRSFRKLRRLRAWLRAGGTWERPETALLRGLSDRLGDLVNFLGARPFFYSDRLSMADLTIYGMLTTMHSDAIPGSRTLIEGRPSLVAFMRSIERETGG
jgi:glutathione S-transferase